MKEEIWRWSAVEMARRIRNKDISSREAVCACFDRIEEVNPCVNALVSLQVDAALVAADAADREVAAGLPLGKLHGVPVSTKINVDQAGLPTTHGVRALSRHIAESDSPVIANLKKAGAVILGRSNAPAFSMRWYTENDLHGRTLNPWHSEVTPGGSSGGAAVAVATGMCAIGHGNDGGGSIRYPAYCTGTVGLRPSFGRVPAFNGSTATERQLSLQLISVQGAITRTVEDSRLALSAMVASDARDPWHIPLPVEMPKGPPPLVAVSIDPANTGVHIAVREHVQKAAVLLADAGYPIESCDPPNVAAAAHAWNAFAQGEARLALGPQIRALGDAHCVRAFELMMNRTPVLDVQAWMQLSASRATMLRNWQLFMQEHPLILCPVAMEPALPYGLDILNDETVDRLYRSHLFLFATAFLGLPSISVPTGIVGGVPMGVHIIGQRFREDMVLDAALVIERACGNSTPVNPRKFNPATEKTG